LLVGLTALAVPEVLGTGYGWVQKGLGSQLLGIPLWIVLILPLARIVATGLSIGSGGSGGIFGPGMVIGAFVGAAVWRLFEPIAPSMGHDPAPYVIVGMMCCFGGISRAPLAVMIMVAEMTGSLSILGPAIVAVGLSWLIVRHFDDTMYRSQLPNRASAPAQQLLVGLPLLAAVPVAEAMARPRVVLEERCGVGEARRALAEAGVSGAPVIDDESRFEGTVTAARLARAPQDDGEIRGLVDAGAPTVAVSSSLDVALEALTTGGASFVPVLDGDRRVRGTLAISDLVRTYRDQLRAHLRPPDQSGAGVVAYEIDTRSDSPFSGRQLRDAELPPGVVVTAIQRNGDVLAPTGDTVIRVGDRLSVLGRPPAADGRLSTDDDGR
ncbi:MAG TPA: chloride channel protein, partial [Acidimicrobiales bacterium]